MAKATSSRLSGVINEAFPHKTCINLNRRPDRWHRMLLRFDQHLIHPVHRFAAFDGNTLIIPPRWRHTPGAYGCLLSHVEVVRQARRLEAPSVLIFEDDVIFDEHLREKFSRCAEQVPPDWDMLFFGALHKDEPLAITDNVVRITKANSTYFYAVRNSVFDDFIELNRRADTVLDNSNFILQERFNCYCFTPHLAWVETDYSDAQNRLEHHWYLKESLVLFGARVDQILAQTTVVIAHRASSGNPSENPLFLARYYDEFFSPLIEIILVEQGDVRAVDEAALPSTCKHVLLRDEGPFDRQRCVQTGLGESSPDRRFVILTDSDLYLETLDIRANLLMCERHDCTTGFNAVFDLSPPDSRSLRMAHLTRGIDITKCVSRPATESPSYCRFFSRDALQRLVEQRDSRPGEPETVPAVDQKVGRRIFRSPNHALRLT